MAASRFASLVDRSVIRFMERRMAPRTPRIEADARDKLIEVAALYNEGTLGRPSRFFPEPPAPSIELRPQGDGPLDTHVVDLRWRSNYEAYLPIARDAYHAFVENNTAHARWWTSGRGRPTIVMLHGWGGGTHWVTARTFVVPYWLRHGYDVVAFQLPFHGERAAGASGMHFPSPNPLRTNEGFGHAIFDLRALAGWLRARGTSAVGVMGMSLGGYTASLWASVGDVDFAVAMIPAVSMAKLMWRHGEQNASRKKAVSAGITEELLEDAFRVHMPTTRAATIGKDRLFIVAGRGDRITPPEQAEALATHWGVDIEWFDGGHLAQVGRGDALRNVRRRLKALALPGCTFRSSGRNRPDSGQ